MEKFLTSPLSSIEISLFFAIAESVNIQLADLIPLFSHISTQNNMQPKPSQTTIAFWTNWIHLGLIIFLSVINMIWFSSSYATSQISNYLLCGYNTL